MVARPLLRSFSWMAGPTPRRRSTVVSKGSGVRPALAAAVAIAARRDFGGEGKGEGEGEGEGKGEGEVEGEGKCEGDWGGGDWPNAAISAGSSRRADNSRTSAAMANRRWASGAV